MTGDSSSPARLTEEAARTAALAAVRSCGLDPGTATFVRLGTRAVFRVAGGRVLARVTLHEHLEAAAHEVEVARWLRAAGVPVDQPWPSTGAYEAGGLVVTLWKAYDGRWGSAGELAAALKSLHSVSLATAPPLRPWDPFPEMRSRLARSNALDGPELSRLLALVGTCEREVRKLKYSLPSGVIHGDANVGNILRTDSGEIVLFDLEGVCTGPREWDLVTTAVYRELGWHTDVEYQQFAEEYGYDVSTWEGYSVLADAQRLRMLCWLAGKVADSADASAAAELRRRVEAFSDTGRPYRWQPL